MQSTAPDSIRLEAISNTVLVSHAKVGGGRELHNMTRRIIALDYFERSTTGAPLAQYGRANNPRGDIGQCSTPLGVPSRQVVDTLWGLLYRSLSRQVFLRPHCAWRVSPPCAEINIYVVHADVD